MASIVTCLLREQAACGATTSDFACAKLLRQLMQTDCDRVRRGGGAAALPKIGGFSIFHLPLSSSSASSASRWTTHETAACHEEGLALRLVLRQKEPSSVSQSVSQSVVEAVRQLLSQSVRVEVDFSVHSGCGAASAFKGELPLISPPSLPMKTTETFLNF